MLFSFFDLRPEFFSTRLAFFNILITSTLQPEKNLKPKPTAADDLVEVVLAGVCASDLWSDCMAGAISALKKAVHTTGGLAHSAQCTVHSGKCTVLAPY